MLIPRFSIRWVLGVTAIAALVLLLVRLGLRGEYWAASVSAAAIFALLALLFHAAFFGVVWLVSELFSGRTRQPASYAAVGEDASDPKGHQP